MAVDQCVDAIAREGFGHAGRRHVGDGFHCPRIAQFALLMPVCARLTRAGRWVIFIAPPYIPYVPALADAGLELARLLLVRAESSNDRLWALEQALKSAHCGAALAWPDRIDDRSLRRLQLACEQGGTSGFLSLQARDSTASPTAPISPP